MMKDNHTHPSDAQQAEGISKEQSYLQFRQLHVRPWIRFWAKVCDLGLLMGIVNLVLMFFLLPIPFMVQLITSFFIGLLWFLIIEPFCLMEWGTTLGRFLFNFTLRTLDGKKLSLREAWSRSFKLWFYGHGCGVHFFSSLANYLAYRRLMKTGATSWDKDKYIVTHGKQRFCRISVALVLIFGPSTLLILYQLNHLPPMTYAPVPASNVIQSTDLKY